MKSNRIGIMQGRLSPIVNNKIQAFPLETWENEFAQAKECGFEIIEWVIDMTDLEKNPLLSKKGRAAINRCIKKYSVEVPSVCCDYFVEFPFHSESLEIRMQAQGMLIELIRVCPKVGIKFIELPLIGKSGIKSDENAEIVIKLFTDLIPVLESQDLYLLLETDLLPEALTNLFKNISSKRIQINYDTGNSAYWGFDPKVELLNYGNRIGNIHIKDCTPKDYSVHLGTGNVNFELVFELLKKLNYRGDFILQTVRGENHVELAQSFHQFTNDYVVKYLK